MPRIMSRWSWVMRGTLLAALYLIAGPLDRLAAQAEATVNRLAPILAAEDARDFQEHLFSQALLDPDPLVVRTAIRAIGRLGDPAGVPLLTTVLARPDTADLQAEAAFALGLVRDTSAAPILIRWLRNEDRKTTSAVGEGVAALAKIGGPGVAAFFTQLLNDPSAIPVDSTHVGRAVAARDAWRLGRVAPVTALLGLGNDSTLRRAVVYDLARLRAKDGATFLVAMTSAPDPVIRGDATRALTKGYATDAGLAPSTVTGALRARLGDDDAGVRINALRALATFGDSTLAHDVVPGLDDPLSNVQVTAATALGLLGGHDGVPALLRILAARRDWAVRREALLALARLDRVTFHAQVTPWANSADWRDRAAAAEGAARGSAAELRPFLADQDPRVVETALQAWATAVQGPDRDLLAAARADLDRPDAMVRAVSADILARAASGGDVPALVRAFRRARNDSFPDAAESALGALAAVAKGPDSVQVHGFLTGEPSPGDPQLRAWAEQNWPDLAEHWVASRPIVTGRSLEDYRAIARQFLVAPDSVRDPRVVIEIADRGNVPVELFGADAPLTVANFLRLVDRHYFDGLRWHRVVPNFVVQAGDPRGDGAGGPGWTIRDEINRRRYGAGILGMALSGPDTGGSQWFITLSAQPHLDGIYTVFGRVTGGTAYLARVTQGDVIRSIHR